MQRETGSERVDVDMEKPGMISRWYDDKGFGFILPKTGGGSFLHISAFRGDRRPRQGDQVWFSRQPGCPGPPARREARLDALTIDPPTVRRGAQAPVTRAQARPAPTPPSALQRPLAKLLVLLILCVLPAAGAGGCTWTDRPSGRCWPIRWPACSHSPSTGGTSAAPPRGDWRTPEVRLHLFELLGGWPGALVAQQVFRHKTRKLSFQLVFWGIVLLHQSFWLDSLLGGRCPPRCCSGSAERRGSLAGAAVGRAGLAEGRCKASTRKSIKARIAGIWLLRGR